MLPHLKKYIAAALFVIACLHVKAQENRYTIQHYTTNDGLPQNWVTSMGMDKNGFLWITLGGGGVCRFDGHNFRPFNMLNTPALATNMVYGFFSLPNGNMEIVGRNRHWYKISANYTITPDSVLSANKWVAFDLERFFLYDSLIKNANWPNALGQPGVPSTIDQNDNLIMNEKECYAFLNFKVFYLNVSTQTILELKTLDLQHAITFVKKHFTLDGMFVSTDRNGVSAYRKGIQLPNIRLSKEAKALMAKVSQGTGHYFCSDNGSFLVSNNSLYRIESNKDSIWTTFLLNDKALDDNNISAIKHDAASGNIYFGTSQGFYMLRPISIYSMDMEQTPTDNTNIVTDVISLDDGNMLSNTQYFNIYTKKTKLLKTVLQYGSLFKCSDGTLLYKKNNTFIWSNQDMQHIYFQKDTRYFTHLIEDKQHAFMWAVFDSGLCKLHKDGKFEKMITITDCTQFIRATENTILLCLAERWVVYDIAKNKIDTNFTHSVSNVFKLYQTRDSAIWFATLGKGFFRYKDGRFTHMPIDNKKRLEITKNFYEDANGFLWIGTSNGLVQCLKTDLDNYALDSTKLPYYYFYDQYDGLLKPDFMTSVSSPYAVDGHGMLVYGTSSGVTYFQPLAMRPLKIFGAIFIETLSVDDSAMAISDHIALRPSFNRLQLSAVLPYFGNRDNVTLEYNISGLNNTWYRVDENGVISIDRLSAGTYKLVVRSQKGFGTNSYQYSSFSFRVLPYFYQTWWFYTLILLTVILCTAFFFLSKTRALVKGKVLLEKQVEARTEKLNESLANLNTTLDDLYKSEQKFFVANEVKEQAMAIIFHDLKAPVRYLDIAANGFRANVEKMSREDITEFSKGLKQSTQEINEFVEGLLQWLVLQQEDFKATYAKIPILGVFKEIAALYKDVAALYGNVIVIEPGLEDIHMNTDRDLLKLIIRNLVDNAVKNTRSGQIHLAATQLDGVAMVTVADNGTGMDKEAVEKLLSYKVDEIKKLKKSSLGFGFVKQFLKLLNGSIRIESVPGIGTQVFVSLNC